MILKLFRRTPRDDSIARLYGTIVAQARAPAFYQFYGVPDTANGRLEMIMLHTVLFLRRLEGEAGPIRQFGQSLFDQFCRDMDDNMREMGVGDLAVPRRMRRIGEAFYGRQAAYRAALDASGDDRLAVLLQRNVFAGGIDRVGAERLAVYVREAERRLAAQDGFERAQFAFPAGRAMTKPERRSKGPWSVPLALSEVPEGGRHLDLVADRQTRTAVAEQAGLDALPRLQASFDVAPHGRGGLRVVGRVSASVGQTCVVTLEPIENEIDEAIDLVFAPGDASPIIGAEVDLSVADASEALIGGGIDLGEIATEFLILGLDPYPRKPDAIFQSPTAGEDSANPFAALAALKKRQRGRQR